MNAIEQGLKEALLEFMQAGTNRDGGEISASLMRITELQEQLPEDASPQLRHYLERRSYQKALDFLENGGRE